MKARWFLLAAVALVAAGCAARKIQVTNPYSQYDNVWDIASNEVAKYFDVKEVDRKAGRIYTNKKEFTEGGRRVRKWCRVDIKERAGLTNRYQVRVDVYRETERPQEGEFNPADVWTRPTKDADLEMAIRSRLEEVLGSLP
jgi:hypothetical protein